MTADPAAQLPTFCHISDFGEYGYRRLHRMIAISQPLTLWSPSSVLLRSKACSVSPDDFVKLVENGTVRIVGRESWLLDRSFRDRHHWDGARWDPKIDGAIRDIFHEDHLGGGARRHPRVAVAPDAGGRQWAAGFLDEHPEQLGFWEGVIVGDRPQDRIPAGTFESIQKMPWDPRGAVEYLLGSARNHGQALANAGSEMDFLLRPADARFLNLMAQARIDGQPAVGPPAPRQAPEPGQEQFLAAQLLEVLARLDDVRGRGGLMRFIGNGGHAELVAWFRTVADLLKGTDPTRFEGELLRHLQNEVRKGSRRGLGSLLDGPPSVVTSVVGAAGVAVDGLQVAQDASVMNLLGVAISTFMIGAGLCQRLGWVGGSFTGIQWPYLYTYGKAPNKDRQTRLLDLLENID
ncbi:hypothetical protein AB0J74_10510 [Asanoa sp. NPDC049573]|uniref:hypothetical protein n=1 Tax=Asanoa sp. NPDC049573 TaxID=3155396 RepID=UPI00344A6472